MTTLGRRILIGILRFSDLLIMSFAFLLGAMAVYFQTGGMHLESFLTMRIKVINFILFVGFLSSWVVILSCFQLYQLGSPLNRRQELFNCLKATLAGTWVIVISGLLFHLYLITPLFLAVFFASSSVLTSSSRLVLRYALESIRRRGRNLRSLLIVGTNSRALRFARSIERKPDLGYRILGFVDNDWPGLEELRKTTYPLKGTFNEVPRIIREQVVDEVVISLPMNSLYEEASCIVSLCEEQGIIVRVLADFFNSVLPHAKSDHFEHDKVITAYPGAIIGWQALLKRVLDLGLSLAMLIFFAPLFGVTALAIKLTSTGPVLFIQERVGLNKRRFPLLKFRTMVVDAEKKMTELEHLNEMRGPVFKIKEDPRITKVGKFLRKASLDELPQLINVLKGDMSIVGPRPLPERDYNGFSQDWQRRRFSVLPGLTCLWQVSGRNTTSFNNWMRLDMQYIDQWSLWLDLKILLKTVPAVLKGSGAS